MSKHTIDFPNHVMDFYNNVVNLIRLHMNLLKSESIKTCEKNISKSNFRNQFKTLQISSTRQIGHTYVALKLLQELPGSMLVVHSTKKYKNIINEYNNLIGKVFPLKLLYSEIVNFKSSNLQQSKKSILKPLIIIDTISLLKKSDINNKQLLEVLNALDNIYDVKLFLFLQ